MFPLKQNSLPVLSTIPVQYSYHGAINHQVSVKLRFRYAGALRAIFWGCLEADQESESSIVDIPGSAVDRQASDALAPSFVPSNAKLSGTEEGVMLKLEDPRTGGAS